MMTKTEIMEFLKNGVIIELEGIKHRHHRPFGEWLYRVKETALEIGIGHFEFRSIATGNFERCKDSDVFLAGGTYKLAADYEYNPKEDEFVEYDVYETGKELYYSDGRVLDLAPRRADFAGFGFKLPDGKVEWRCDTVGFLDENGELWGHWQEGWKVVRLDFVRFVKE